jgi:hypothetical protein
MTQLSHLLYIQASLLYFSYERNSSGGKINVTFSEVSLFKEVARKYRQKIVKRDEGNWNVLKEP